MSPSIAAGFNHLRLKYPGDENGLLFQGLSFSALQGEKVLLLGPSGCGKSTALQVLSGLVPRTIELPMKADAIIVPDRSGYVFQDPDAQFCMPYVDEELAFVLENVSVPREQMDGIIKGLLDTVGLKLRESHTLIQTLSQGMKQRLAVAAALALEPDVLFLDEPTALLDTEGTRQVWDTIKRTSGDKTVLIVEHKIDEIIDWVDRVAVMGPDGTWLADGSPRDIFASHRELFKAYGIWYPGVWEDRMEISPLREFGTGYRRNGTERATGFELASRNKDEASRDKDEASRDKDEASRDKDDASRNKDEASRDKDEASSLVAASTSSGGNPVLLQMENFKGFRGIGGTAKITVDRLNASAGEWISVIGKNGAGKSSLLLAIMRLIRTEGLCLVRGKERKKVVQLADYASFVFQNPEFQFVAGTVESEIAFSLPASLSKDEKERRIHDILESFHLLPLIDKHPYALSMGQKRRLSVAVSIERGQKLLLLDEPTFGLDARNTFSMLERLERLREDGAAIIMITHDENIVRHYSTRIWRVEEGHLAELAVTEEAPVLCN
ncbi:ATP-binding cassette domain-containing protein [Paenibacillus sp. GCM10027627]|uniref:ABC transporter ATP-binding protein n=1 Tax=unclassified Paenibacillus TaxID=185978 RepID=UPI00363220C4